MTSIKSVLVEDNRVSVVLNGGKKLKFEDCWLRDNCRCDACYSQETFQRKQHLLDIPLAKADSVTVHEDALHLRISWCDGHASSYSVDFLQAYHFPTWVAARVRIAPLWRGEPEAVARVNLQDLLDTGEGTRRVFKSLLDHGVAFIAEVAPDVESTRAVCEVLGGVQQTLFGGMWKFTTEGDHADTAYTNLPLAPHTDSTYFTESTGLQVLHCIEHSGGSGGDTVLVDGFYGASLLREKSQEHFRYLTAQVSEAEYVESGHHHRHAGPILNLDPVTGDLQQVRFNVYDRSPMAFSNSEECRGYYTAMRELSRIYQDPQHQWWFKLNPGTVLVMDNWRVLHGRSAFSGRRVVCGSYVARSDWRDRARVLGLLH